MKLEDFFSQRTNYVDPNAERVKVIPSPELPVATPEEMATPVKYEMRGKELVKTTPKQPVAQPVPPIPGDTGSGTIDVNLQTQGVPADPSVPQPLAPTNFSGGFQGLPQSSSITEQEEEIDRTLAGPEAMRSPASGDDASSLWYFLPAALGALTGNAEGFGASAGIINQARTRQEQIDDFNRSLEGRLQQLAAQRKAAAAGKPVLVDKDGLPIYEDPQAAIGQQAFVKDGKEGMSMEDKIKLYKATRGETADKNLALRKEQQEENESRNARKDFVNDKQVAPTMTALDTVKELREALKTPGWAGAVTAQAKFIRGVLKEVGNLNESEQQRASVSPSWVNRTTQFINKIQKGDPLTNADRQSLMDIMNRMESVYAISLHKKADAYSKSVKNSTGRDIRPVLDPFLPPIPSTKSSKKIDYSQLSEEELDRRLRGGGQ